MTFAAPLRDRAVVLRTEPEVSALRASIARGEPDDWTPCPDCKFVSVACDCGANVQWEKKHAA